MIPAEMMHKLRTMPRTVGVKETTKALSSDEVHLLYVAKDADLKIVSDVIETAKTKRVPIEFVNTMVELGKACEVDVKTATAALINKKEGGAINANF